MTQPLDKAARSNKTVKELAGRAMQDAITKAEQDPSFLEDMWAQVKTTGRLFTTWARGKYKTSPWWTILLGVGSMVYLISPIDLLPDFLIAGVLDDATLLGIFWASLQHDVKRFKRWEERVAEFQETHPQAALPAPAAELPAELPAAELPAEPAKALDLSKAEPAQAEEVAKAEPAQAEEVAKAEPTGDKLGPELD
jgi:uncharacterized membrane protein YkvA (DUF1232 family)